MWKYLLAIFMLLTSFTAYAQPGGRGERFEQIKEARETFLKEELALTTEESAAFFPVFWEYDLKVRQARRKAGIDRRKNAPDLGALSEAEALALLRENRQRRQELLALEIEAQDAFLKILPARKVVLLPPAEKAFREKLLQRLQQRRGGPR